MPNLSRRAAALKQSKLTIPTRLVLFKVQGRAVPWSVSRKGTKNPHLFSWQQAISLEARKAYGLDREPYEGPVGVSAWFYIRPPCKGHTTLPDTTNLFKAFEDALQGEFGVIRNDRQVSGTHPERVIVAPHDPEYAYGEVWAIPRVDTDLDDASPYNYRPWLWMNMGLDMAVG